MDAGHISSSSLAPGTEFYAGTMAELQCDPEWTFINGTSSKEFMCVADTVFWENCTGLYAVYILVSMKLEKGYDAAENRDIFTHISCHSIEKIMLS